MRRRDRIRWLRKRVEKLEQERDWLITDRQNLVALADEYKRRAEPVGIQATIHAVISSHVASGGMVELGLACVQNKLSWDEAKQLFAEDAVFDLIRVQR